MAFRKFVGAAIPTAPTLTKVPDIRVLPGFVSWNVYGELLLIISHSGHISATLYLKHNLAS